MPTKPQLVIADSSVEGSHALRSLKDEIYGSCQFILVEVIAAEAVKDGTA